MTLYLDTSAVVKLYVAEPHSEEVAGLVSERGGLSSVVLAAETLAAIGKARREGTLTAEASAGAAKLFRTQAEDYGLIPVTPELSLNAGQLALEYGLKGYDAVHLASALIFGFAVNSPITFATFDRALWRAARDEGLDAWPTGWGD